MGFDFKAGFETLLFPLFVGLCMIAYVIALVLAAEWIADYYNLHSTLEQIVLGVAGPTIGLVLPAFILRGFHVI